VLVLAADAVVVVPVEAMRIGRQDREVPLDDVFAIEVRWSWRYAPRGMRHIAHLYIIDGVRGGFRRRRLVGGLLARRQRRDDDDGRNRDHDRG
jgi:hypothetical protein